MSDTRLFSKNESLNPPVISEELKEKHFKFSQSESIKAALFAGLSFSAFVWSIVDIISKKNPAAATTISFLSLALSVMKFMESQFSYVTITDGLDSNDVNKFTLFAKALGKKKLDEHLTPKNLIRPDC